MTDVGKMSKLKRAGILTTLLALVEFGVVPNSQNGFYCDDPSISFRFMGDTITITVLLLGTFLLPIFFTLGIEWALLRWQYMQGIPDESDEDDNRAIESDNAAYTDMQPCIQSITSTSQEAKEVIACVWPWYREFLLGLGINFLVMDLTKVLVGEPRPHFLDTCKPDLAKNCTSGYVEKYECTNQWISIWEIRDASKSFPSGHASVSVYTALFMMWFTQKRIPGRPTFLITPLLHCLWITWALVCSITRIIDHRHHWWDVLGGTLLGIAVTVFTVKTQCSHDRVLNDPEAHSFTRVKQMKKRMKQLQSAEKIKEENVNERYQWVRKMPPSSSSRVPEERELKDIALS
ncbi:hypothetical protein J437_LFUL007029 [Ladona fulva]|uniref:Phosphatidic acid phosphatase type 2/haloperoxidase domain-containing protein n=1 Tax=Ladona fulva TaxID=123851 RepID=A0A8K0K5W5_LADFU|nr:hypothetical protein J437_LFUL007029 [Ladona fulva]